MRQKGKSSLSNSEKLNISYIQKNAQIGSWKVGMRSIMCIQCSFSSFYCGLKPDSFLGFALILLVLILACNFHFGF